MATRLIAIGQFASPDITLKMVMDCEVVYGYGAARKGKRTYRSVRKRIVVAEYSQITA